MVGFYVAVVGWCDRGRVAWPALASFGALRCWRRAFKALGPPAPRAAAATVPRCAPCGFAAFAFTHTRRRGRAAWSRPRDHGDLGIGPTGCVRRGPGRPGALSSQQLTLWFGPRESG